MILAIRSSAGARVALYSSTIAISVLVSSSIYERLVAARLVPESFLLEFIGFCALWLVADLTVGRCFAVERLRAVILQRPGVTRRFVAFFPALCVTSLWLQVGNFAAEIAMFGALWFVLDRSIAAAARAIRPRLQ